MQGHSSGGVWSVRFSSAGSLLLNGGDDGTIKFWEVDTGKCLKTVRSDKPYEGTNMTGTLGLTDAQKVAIDARIFILGHSVLARVKAMTEHSLEHALSLEELLC